MRSLSARRAWIEIPVVGRAQGCRLVALRKESVDRNVLCEGVFLLLKIVALRKESVDRNSSIDNLTQGIFKSLSARRAWIEILLALAVWPGLLASLSARRAWIEILLCGRWNMLISCRSPQGERG